MKIILAVAAFATMAAIASPAAAAGNNICISTRNIVSSTPQQDGAAILFKMRDGSMWRNDLQGRCPDLKFNGYAWTLRNPDERVCENEQSLRVLLSGEVCTLGKFTQVKPAREKPM